jgi:hypothetical protein
MNKINQVQDDEIDLFQLLQTLWDAKRPISAFIVIAVLLGGSFLFFSNNLYQSKIIYSLDSIPPFYSAEKVSADFKKMFYTKNMFKDWEKNNENTALVFEDFSLTNVVNGYVLSKNKNLLLAVLGEGKKETAHILVKSDQFSILDDFFMYAEYINKLLKAEYVNKAKDELNINETKFKDFSNANEAVFTQLLTINRFIVSAENGTNLIYIKRPTLPERVPSSSLILALSIILGGMIGVIYVLISNAIRKRKDKLVKA